MKGGGRIQAEHPQRFTDLYFTQHIYCLSSLRFVLLFQAVFSNACVQLSCNRLSLKFSRFDSSTQCLLALAWILLLSRWVNPRDCSSYGSDPDPGASAPEPLTPPRRSREENNDRSHPRQHSSWFHRRMCDVPYWRRQIDKCIPSFDP